MTKIYKPINDKYLSTSGIYHRNRLLSNFLDNKNYIIAYLTTGTYSSTYSERTKFQFYSSVGSFTIDRSVGYIKIPKNTCNYIMVSGMIAGYGFSNITIFTTYDSYGGDYVEGSNQNHGILVQASGNKYWKHSLPCRFLWIDSSRDVYVSVLCTGYNEDFELNAGFGNSASWIQVIGIE